MILVITSKRAGSAEYLSVLSTRPVRIARKVPCPSAGYRAHGTMNAMKNFDGGLVVNTQAFVGELLAKEVLLVHHEARCPQFLEVPEKHGTEHIAGAITLVYL